MLVRIKDRDALRKAAAVYSDYLVLLLETDGLLVKRKKAILFPSSV
jgi:hypothetical protein